MKKTTKKEVYATWKLDTLEVGGEFEGMDFEDQFYIQCGVGDDQWESFTPADNGARLIVERVKDAGYLVTLTAPALDLAKHKDYWLSPSCPGADEVESDNFGMRDVKGGR